jgi:hypothetical protein
MKEEKKGGRGANREDERLLHDTENTDVVVPQIG